MASPLRVNYTRGTLIESEHLVDALVVDAQGCVIHQYGDIDRPVFPRSAIKPLQALALVESGAIEKFNLGQKEIALACASHSGEAVHTSLVEAWLKRLVLGEDALECGHQLPGEPKRAACMVCEGKEPGAIHNNCSGKHAGFLSACLSLGFNHQGYIHYDHVLQVQLRKHLSEAFEVDMSVAPWGTDGCGIPTYALPLRSLATGARKFLQPSTPIYSSLARVLEAIKAEPYLIAGKERYCTKVCEVSGARVVAKYGAQGVFMALVPSQGVAIVLKTRSGLTQAAEAALTHLLCGQRALLADEAIKVFKPQIHNWAGETVGEISVSV